MPVFRTDTKDAVEATRSGLERARADGLDTVIVDTAGRLQIDEELMDELARVRDEAKPQNVLLVLDAMTGQEAVNVAEAFDERIAFDGVILTKLDGDARGGAALSVKAITGKPIKFASTGEKLDALEVFHPDRMASRILGMGDVLTLIERAEAAVEEDDQAEMEKRLRAGQFTFDDFLKAYKMLRRMGPLQGILKMIPGLNEQLGDVEVDEKQLGRVEAIVLSMTPQERRSPIVIDGKRRIRIANGSGATVEQVNQLLEARKQMEKMMKQMGRGKMPALPNQQAPARAFRRRGRRGRSARKRRPDGGKGIRMAVKLRLTRVGSKKNPIYRVVAADSRSPRDGKFLEIVGRYNPQTDPSTIELDAAKVKDWLGKGAQPTEAVAKLIKISGIEK